MSRMKVCRAAWIAATGGLLAFSAALRGADDVYSIHLVSRPYEVNSGVFSGSQLYGVDAGDGRRAVEFEPGRAPVYEDGEAVRTVAVRPARQEPAFKTVVVSPTPTPWMRIRFADYELGEASYIVLTSLADGDWQYFDEHYLDVYSKTSGIFGGEAVELALYVAPQDRGVFVNVGEVMVADPAYLAERETETVLDGGVASICGDLDDRVSSNDPRCGRLFFGGCTGWLVHNGVALTAGHCGTPDGNLVGVTLEFNVPSSGSDGTPNQAVMNDQYPITSVIRFESDGEGADYAVFRVGPNSNTGLRPHLAQGFYHMTGVVPSEGTTVRVTGYGVDNRPAGPSGACCARDGDGDCTHTNCNSSSLTQQTDTGSCDDCLAGTAIEHTVDTEPANSGSPIIWNSKNVTIAIHAQGGCDSFFSDFDNAGTWLGYDPLENALNGVRGANTTWVNAVTGSDSLLFQFGSAIFPAGSVGRGVSLVPEGGELAIVAGSYPASAGNTFTTSRAMTLVAPVGMVTIGE